MRQRLQVKKHATVAVPMVSTADMSEDHELVRAVQSGEKGAFERLLLRYQKLVWHLVYRMVQQPEDARELCQDVFFRVHERLHQYRFESSLATWIGRIAYTVTVRHLQKKRLPLVEPDADDASESALLQVADGFDLETACADAEVMAHMGAAIECLPPIQRTLVTLYHLEELGITDIAAITGLPEGTVKNYLFRARQKLKSQLQARLGELV